MNVRRSCLSSLALMLVGLLGGIALGVLIGWVIWPVNYVDTGIVDLRAGYQDDYIMMVADAYVSDGDLALAQRRLSHLADPNLKQRIRGLVESKMDAGEPPDRVRSLVALAQGMQVDTHDMLDYVATPAPTSTPRPTLTAAPTATHAPPTATVDAPTATPTTAATATPASVPTRATPASLDVPKPAISTSPDMMLEAETPTLSSTTAVSPTYGSGVTGDFVVSGRRMLHKIEVGGCEAPARIYIKTIDPEGRPVDGVVMKVAWDGGEFPPVVTGSDGPGTAVTLVWAGDYYIDVIGNVGGEDLAAERSPLLRTAYAAMDDLIEAGYCESLSVDECKTQRDHNGLCGGHYSYEVIYQRQW